MTGEQNQHYMGGNQPGTAQARGSMSHELTSPPEQRTVTKKELVSRIADRTGQTKVVTKDIIQMFLDEIISELGRGNRLEFREFGVFEIKERAARKAQPRRSIRAILSGLGVTSFPAQKARPAPLTTMHLTSQSASASLRAATRSRCRAEFKAFSFSGRFKVIHAMLSRESYRTVSYSISTSLA